LRQYAECERVLEAELGVPPSPETAQLYERIRDREDLPETGSLAETRFLHNLPTSLTPFVGRKEELAELSRLLADPDVRLLTVLGPGGSGKTRLSLEAAAGELGSHEHGVFYVPLAPLQSAEAIVPAVAQALGCTFYGRGDPRQQLLDYLRQRDVLLVLDNLEHLLDGVDLIDEVLRGAPDVKVLATSRARLSVRGEHLYHVRGMDYPRDDRGTTGIRLGDYDAVTLFLRSACRAQEEYEPTDEDLVHIAQICRMVEGMPLAILLAATWVDALSLAEITVQIERGLDFLETDWRGVAERHHSMRAVFDASFELLTGLEREVFARLSVFRGGFTAEAAGAVAGADLRVLRGLVRKSFLQRGQTGRYEVHELLRQYGGGRLDERPSEKEHVLNLHGAYYAEFLYRRETNMWKGSQEALPEIENIRTAMHWATMHRKVAEIHKCLSGLSLYGPLGLNQEGKNACGKAIDALRIGQADELNEEREAALAMALVLQGFFSAALGPIDQVQELVQEGLSVLRRLGDQRKLMWGYSLAVAAGTVQDLSEARQILEKSLTISREMDDYSTMSRALWLLGRIALTQGAHREAEQYCREALAISRRNDDRGGASSALAFLGHTLYVRGEYARARQCYEESLDLRNELGKAMTTGRLYQHLGDVALAMGDYEEAREHHQQALAVYRDGDAYWIEERVVLGGCWGIPVSLQTLGDVALATGDTVEAKQYYRRGLQMARDESYVELRLHLLLGPIKWLARRGNVEGAVELAALARHHPASIEETRGKAEELLHGLQAELPSEAYAAAEERGRARDLRATVEELLEELEGMESE
jgi:predicted ATPase